MEEYREFETGGPYRRDTSIGVRPSETGVVDTIVMTQSNEGGKMYKIRVRDMRIPEIGDKFASRHGQKGILGILANNEDLPYTADGCSSRRTYKSTRLPFQNDCRHVSGICNRKSGCIAWHAI